ncbi:MAG: hypothetical protein MPJ24_00260 [Pirellulaceae bacterium]|nr:hypothetical protein [Pirellulaceae bacterium]
MRRNPTCLAVAALPRTASNYHLLPVFFFVFGIVLFSSTLYGGERIDEKNEKNKTVETQDRPTNHQLFQSFRYRNVGPNNMMGRIAAIDALNTDYRTVLIGSASGGVFKSTNAGLTWEAIFDDYGSGSIGDVAFFQKNPNIIWVGTGESANRNSSGWGDGIYKSTDGGRSFKNMGLKETHHIAELAVHPTDPNIVYAAAVGHLWGYSGTRGLYKTSDGGKTWDKLSGGLPTDPKTGCTEIIMDPSDPEVLYAGFYHRLRGPATMHSGGREGGIYKSTDSGKSWKKLTEGLPTGETGMIDISICRKFPQIVVAAVEASDQLPRDKSVPNSGVYRSDDGGNTWKYLYYNATRPFYHGQVEIDPNDPDRIYYVSRSFAHTRDGGKTWRGRKPWRSTGGDDHDLWICPYDSKINYTATDQGAYLTVDDRTSLALNNMAIGQYYAIGVDQRDPYYIIGGLQDNGLWIGPSNSRERRGILTMHNKYLGNGDGFHSQIDPTDWRIAYIVNHVGFAARKNLETEEFAFITPTPETITNYLDYYDPNFDQEPIVYTIAPGEHWFFGADAQRPKLPVQFRFNWSSPLVMSPTDPKTLYFGSNYLFKSTDRGDTWEIISDDLTTNDVDLRNPNGEGGLTISNTGGENHCTIMTISQSPFDDQVVWVGTDDGNVQVTQNGGKTWSNVRLNIQGIPKKIWVSRVAASHHEKGTAYVTLDNHRHDDMKPYVYKTTDFGKSWTNISSNLPENGSVYVIQEDAKNPNFLLVGTEFAMFASIDGGKSWERFMNGMPTVAMYDALIHPRDSDLVVGTHGRSIWIADDLTPLQQLTDEVLAKKSHLFESRRATKWISIDLGRKQSNFDFRGQNPPSGALIHYYLQERAGRVDLQIEDLSGNLVTTIRRPATGAGIQRATWNMSFRPTAEQEAALKSDLREGVEYLKTVIPEDKERVLSRLEERLESSSGMRGLNGVRASLVNSFGAYAPGRPIFGKKLENISAPAGEYRVTLTVDGVKHSSTLTVRDDPLKGQK